jgi:ApaG protein
MSKPELSCKVVVRPLPEQTDAAQDQYAYAYSITITNTGDTAAQLIARHWWITDHRGQVQEVRGLGLVGHQPLLNPSESFAYSSWVQIATPMGTMRGTYISHHARRPLVRGRRAGVLARRPGCASLSVVIVTPLAAAAAGEHGPPDDEQQHAQCCQHFEDDDPHA